MGRKVCDLTGQIFGRLTVLGFSHINKNKKSMWRVQCSCGTQKIILGCSLIRGATKSCGCHRNIYRENLIGQVFNRLTVVEFSHIRGHYFTYWKVRCTCGNYKIVSAYNLRLGAVKSCGCLSREYASKLNFVDLTGKIFGNLTVAGISATPINRVGTYWEVICSCGTSKIIKGNNLTNGHTRSCGCLHKQQLIERNTTHGLSHTKEYQLVINRNRQEKERKLDAQWTPLMELCLRDYQPACVVCGTTSDLATDHVLPLSKGNGLYPGNAVRLCRRHNSMKWNKPLDKLPVEMATKIREAAESFCIAWSGGF